MKLSSILSTAVTCVLFLNLNACDQVQQNYSKEVRLNTIVDSVSYAIGHQYGSQLGIQGLSDVGMEEFMAGFVTGLDGENSKIDVRVLQDLFSRFSVYIVDKIKTENKMEGDTFLASNREKEGVVETASGLQYKVIEEGTGASPTPQDSVVVRYEGKLIDGTIFDSTYERGDTAQFLLGGVIQGWTEGLQLMQEGSTYEFYIPSELAYGENPRPGGVIKPNHTLIFKVELLEVK